MIRKRKSRFFSVQIKNCLLIFIDSENPHLMKRKWVLESKKENENKEWESLLCTSGASFLLYRGGRTQYWRWRSVSHNHVRWLRGWRKGIWKKAWSKNKIFSKLSYKTMVSIVKNLRVRLYWTPLSNCSLLKIYEQYVPQGDADTTRVTRGSTYQTFLALYKYHQTELLLSNEGARMLSET